MTKLIEGPNKLIVEERVPNSPVGPGALLVGSIAVITAGFLLTDDPATNLGLGVIFLLPFLILGLFLVRKSYKVRHVFDLTTMQYVSELVGVFGVKKEAWDLRRIKLIGVAKDISDEYDVYKVKLVFEGDADSLYADRAASWWST